MQSLLDKIVDIAREAGTIALDYQKNGFKTFKKGLNDIVTDADLEVNRFLKEKLLSLVPDSGWLSEESIDDKERLTKRFVWIVDPIDGTRQFSKGTDEWCISIALVEEQKPIIGVVYNPRKDQMFFAERCIGAFLNDYRIRNNHLQGKRQLILTTKSKTNFLKIFTHGLQKNFQIEQIGSLAYILALVSSGYASSCISFKASNEWDIAAGVLLLQEAGCSIKIMGTENHELKFNKEDVYYKNGFFGANKKIFEIIEKKTEKKVH